MADSSNSNGLIEMIPFTNALWVGSPKIPLVKCPITHAPQPLLDAVAEGLVSDFHLESPYASMSAPR